MARQQITRAALDKPRPIQHFPTPPPVIPAKAGTQSSPLPASAHPREGGGLPRVRTASPDPRLRGDERKNEDNLSARVPHAPKLHASFPRGAAPVPFGLWEGRPGGWGVAGVTARNLSRDVDPGKPDQKAGRESRLARLGVYPRSRELMVSGQGLAAPKSSRKLPETPVGSARRAKRPHRKHIFYPGAAAPAAQAPPWGQTPTQTRMVSPVRIRTYGDPMAKRRREPRIDYACIAAPEDRAALLRYTGAPEWLIARALRDAPPQALRALGHPQRRRQRTRPISRRRPCPSGAGSRP